MYSAKFCLWHIGHRIYLVRSHCHVWRWFSLFALFWSFVFIFLVLQPKGSLYLLAMIVIVYIRFMSLYGLKTEPPLCDSFMLVNLFRNFQKHQFNTCKFHGTIIWVQSQSLLISVSDEFVEKEINSIDCHYRNAGISIVLIRFLGRILCATLIVLLFGLSVCRFVCESKRRINRFDKITAQKRQHGTVYFFFLSQNSVSDWIVDNLCIYLYDNGA